jgi:hypothetical protein
VEQHAMLGCDQEAQALLGRCVGCAPGCYPGCQAAQLGPQDQLQPAGVGQACKG